VGLGFRFSAPIPASRLEGEIVYPAQNFLTFATDHLNSLIDFRVSRDIHENEIQVIGPRTFSDDSIAREMLPFSSLFTLSDIRDRFVDVFRRWFEFSRKFDHFCTFYFGQLYNPPGFTDVRFQMLGQAITIYAAHSEFRFPPCDVDLLLSRLSGGLQPADITPLKEAIESSLLIRFRRALKGLLPKYRHVFSALLGEPYREKEAAFIEGLLRTFRFVLLRDDPENLSDGLGFFWGAERLGLILKLILLDELGFSSEQQFELLKRNRNFEYLRSSFDNH